MTARDDPSLRVPPHSVEAEQSVLGGLLLDSTAWDRIGDLLDERDFYRSEHRRIFAAINGLVLAHNEVDVITVHDQLKRGPGAGDDDGCGLAYLNALAQSVPSASNVRRYAEIVREHADRRALIAATRAAAEIAWTEHGSIAEQRDRIGNIFAVLDRRSAAKEPRDLDELIAERLDHYSELASGSKSPGIPTGILSLDRALNGGLKRGTLVVDGARPTVGKTSFAGQVANAVAALGEVVLVCSQEMPAGDLIDRFIANAAAVGLGGLASGQLTSAEWSQVSEGADALRSRRIFIDDSPALSMMQIRAKARQVLRRTGGLALVVVDYLQLCSSPLIGDRRHHQIEAISRGLKQLAMELDVCVLLLSQINRESANRPGAEPEMSDLKESGAIEEDADVVLLLHPISKDTDGSFLMLLKLAKNRQGRRGRIALRFDGNLQRWSESSADVSRRKEQR